MTGRNEGRTAVETFGPNGAIDDGASLFSPGGPFEGFPGALVLAGHNGIVLGSNHQAEPIGAMLRSDRHPELRDGVRSALAGATAQIHPLLVPESNNGKETIRAYDLIILPWIEGAAALLLGRDITLERALRASLVESHERYKALVEMAADFAWECDDEGCFSFMSKDRVLGHAAIDLLGRAAGDLLAGAGGDPFCAGEPAVPVCCELRRASGDLVSVEITAMPFTDKDGRHMGTRGLCRSIVAESAA